MDELTPGDALAIGGWDPTRARVLIVVSNANDAIALIDSDQDGYRLHLDVLTRGTGGEWTSSEQAGADAQSIGQTARIDYAWGQAAPGAVVTVEHHGAPHAVVASQTGWWAFIGPSDPGLAAAGRAVIQVAGSPEQDAGFDNVRPIRRSPSVQVVERDGHGVTAQAIVRVFCVDGPVHGLQYLDEDTGRILFEHADQHTYRVNTGEYVLTDFGPCLAAYFEHTVPPA